MTLFSFTADKVRGAVRKFPESFDTDVMVHHEFLLARFAEVARCSSEEAVRQVAGRDKGSSITIKH
jgi:hypothetical protein